MGEVNSFVIEGTLRLKLLDFPQYSGCVMRFVFEIVSSLFNHESKFIQLGQLNSSYVLVLTNNGIPI